ncbi:MAG: hypothetical protein ABGW69_01985 [Nanoarchaeota archaeon]
MNNENQNLNQINNLQQINQANNQLSPNNFQIKQDFNPIEELNRIIHEKKALLEEIKRELEKEEDIISLAVLPPRPEKEYRGTIFLTVFIDDINIKGEKLVKMRRIEEKIKRLMEKYKEISINLKTMTEVWNQFNEGEWENFNPLVPAYILFDKKMVIQAIKIGFVHRDLVKKHFERYLMSYALFGSVAKLQPREDSDIDFAIIIDDTDLKEMSKYQAREHIMQIAYNLLFEAKRITGIDKEIHLQVYLVTDLWDSIKDANPVIVSFLRDAVAFYDNGVLIPWKRLLEQGKIKPTTESIDNYFKLGEELSTNIFNKLRNLVMEDIFWATVTPAQAIIMALGYEPPYPKEIPEVIRRIKEKEGIFDEEDIKFLEEIIKYRKGLEHGTIKELKGKTVDELEEKAKRFFSKMKKLYREILLNYRSKEVKTLYVKIIKLLSILYNINKLSLIRPLIEKGKIDYEIMDYLPIIEEFEENNKITEDNIEILWKAFKIILRNLEEEFEKMKKEKLSKLILKGKKGDKEVVILITREGIGVSEDGKIVKLYKKDKVEEVPFNVVFDQIIEIAENQEEIMVDLSILEKLEIKLVL